MALTIVALLAPAAHATASSHPHQLSWVNGLIGGIEGAKARGMEVTNLKEVLNREALEELAGFIPEDALVDGGFFIEEICFYQAIGWAPAGWRAETQLMRSDGAEDVALACEGPQSFVTVALDRNAREPDYVFVLNRPAQWRSIEGALVDFGGPPAYAVSLEGVPLLMVYRTR